MTDPAYAIGNEFVVNSELPYIKTDVAVAALAGGGFVMTWLRINNFDVVDSRTIRARIFNPDGTPAGDDFQLDAGGTEFFQFAPSVTGLPGGGFAINWWTADGSADGSRTAILGKVYNAIGTAAGPEFLVNTTAPGDQIAPVVAATGNPTDESFWSIWVSAPNEGKFGEIKAQHLSGTGERIGVELTLDQGFSGSSASPVAATLASGAIVVAWETLSAAADGSGSALTMRILDADGTGVTNEVILNDIGTGTQISPQIAALTDGGFVVTWFTTDGSADGDSTAIKARLFDASGVPRDGEFLVNTEATSFQSYPVATGLADGGFAITWSTGDAAQDGSGLAIKGQVFAADGTKVAGEFLVNSETLGNQDISTIATLADGRVVVGWLNAQFDNIAAQIFGIGNAPSPGGPEITSAGGGDFAFLTLGENELFVTDVTAIDPDGDPISYAIVGGADQFQFTIDATTGIVFFAGMPDFERPADSDGDNIYDVIVEASANGESDSQQLTITVTNGNDVPEITSYGHAGFVQLTIPENSAGTVATVAATDPDGDAVRYVLADDYIDSILFEVDVMSGAMRFRQAPDFEAPRDADGDNVYEVLVYASDDSLATSQLFRFTITDVIESGNSTTPLVDRAGTVTGRSSGNETLTGDIGPNTFFVDANSGTTGRDRITNFGNDDVLVLTRQLVDDNGDGIITFGRNGLVDLLGADADGSQIDLSGLSGRKGLRYMGEVDPGYFAYADATVRPRGALEGHLATDDVLNGDTADTRRDIFFFDTALGADPGTDIVGRFGQRDILVFTTALSAPDADGIIDVRGGLALSPGGVLQVTDLASADVDGIALAATLQHDGTTYFIYGTIGSTHSGAELTFI